MQPKGLGNDPTARILKQRADLALFAEFLGLGNDPTARILKQRADLALFAEFLGLGNDPTARILKRVGFALVRRREA